MEYRDLVRDFARRTRANLELLRARQTQGEQVYEVTQLINSMLGLLVFPQQKYLGSLPDVPIDTLKRQGWPVPQVAGSYTQPGTLKELLRLLRNSIAHCNLEFNANGPEISGVLFWNKNNRGETTWKGTLSVEDLQLFVDRFLDLLLADDARA